MGFKTCFGREKIWWDLFVHQFLKFQLGVKQRKPPNSIHGTNYPNGLLVGNVFSTRRFLQIQLSSGGQTKPARENIQDEVQVIHIPMYDFWSYQCRSNISKSNGNFFRGLMGPTMAVYLDDFMLILKKRSKHLLNLEQIFERCRKYGISLNHKKRIFMLSEGIFLRHIITRDRITVNLGRM